MEGDGGDGNGKGREGVQVKELKSITFLSNLLLTNTSTHTHTRRSFIHLFIATWMKQYRLLGSTSLWIHYKAENSII